MFSSMFDSALRDAAQALATFLQAENQRRQEKHDHNMKVATRNGERSMV